MDINTRKLLANCLIQCHFEYASSYWYNYLTVKTKQKLQTSPNKVIRFVFDMSARAHLESAHFKQMGWLPVSQRVTYIKLNHVYRVKEGLAPKYLSENLVFNSYVHSTRSGPYSIFIPSGARFYRNSFVYTASHEWNKVPRNIQSVTSISLFKKKLKKYFYDEMNRNESNDFVFY